MPPTKNIILDECSVCELEYRVQHDGNIVKHGPLQNRCDGGGKPPKGKQPKVLVRTQVPAKRGTPLKKPPAPELPEVKQDELRFDVRLLDGYVAYSCADQPDLIQHAREVQNRHKGAMVIDRITGQPIV